MAIYSCNLKSIGRTTHEPGTAGAHLRYISREEAAPHIMARHMPADPVAARTWMDQRERAMRKNARVIDKIRIALPRELDEAQREALVEAFMEDLTGGRVPWFAAIHQHGEDAHNPHVHIAVHDRDITTGKRLLRLSDNARDRIKAGLPGPKAVEWMRERWEVICNDALARAGIDARIDRRTLTAQGIDRTAGVHEGPRAQHIEGRVRRPRSRRRVNGCGRVIDYPAIDHGRTRREFNAQIIDLNLERAMRSGDPVRAAWAGFEKEQLAEDRQVLARVAAEEQRHTATARKAAEVHRQRLARLRAARDHARREAAASVQRQYNPQREAMRAKQAQERMALKDRQSRLRARLFRLLDITGTTRRRQEAARKLLAAEHRAARKELTARYRAARAEADGAVRTHHAATIGAALAERRAQATMLNARRKEIGALADTLLQQREIERDHARRLTEAKIETWKKDRKDGGPLGVESGFAQALRKAARQEARRGSGRGKDDIERER